MAEAATINAPKFGDKRTDLCSRHGQFEETFARGSGLYALRDGWSGCPACREEYSTACSEACRKRDARDRAARSLSSSNIPRRHRRKTLENFVPHTEDQRAALSGAKSYANNWAENYDVARCLSFVGPPGTGKTHLACAVLSAIGERGISVKYTTASDFIYEIRSTWRKDSDRTAEGVVAKYARPDLLLLDDVGCLAAEYEHVRHLLDKRYNDELPTMITSNLGPNELASYIDVRGVDRLRENGGLMFALSGTSRRAIPDCTVIEEPLWWEEWLSNDPYKETQRQLREDAEFTVNMSDFPGLCTEPAVAQ